VDGRRIDDVSLIDITMGVDQITTEFMIAAFDVAGPGARQQSIELCPASRRRPLRCMMPNAKPSKIGDFPETRVFENSPLAPPISRNQG
jgi:hypothetical protein